MLVKKIIPQILEYVKPAGYSSLTVKAQFGRITKQHVEYVLRCMDGNPARARNIRAVLVTALYNSVHTMSSYYRNLVQHHMANGFMENIPEGGKKVEQ